MTAATDPVLMWWTWAAAVCPLVITAYLALNMFSLECSLFVSDDFQWKQSPRGVLSVTIKRSECMPWDTGNYRGRPRNVCLYIPSS